MVLQFWVEDRCEGSASLTSDLLVAYEAHQGLVPSMLSYTETDESVVILTLKHMDLGLKSHLNDW